MELREDYSWFTNFATHCYAILQRVMSSGETHMRLRHLVAEIFVKKHSAKIVNEL